MTRRDLSTLFVQLLGLYWFAYVLRMGPDYMRYFLEWTRVSKPTPNRSELVYYAVLFAVYVGVPLLLLIGARSIARWMTADMSGDAVELKVLPTEARGVAISVAGLWVIALQFPDIIRDWVRYSLSFTYGTTGPFKLSGGLQALGGVLVILFGLWLAFGWRGISRMISGLREAGVSYPEPEVDDDEEDEEPSAPADTP
ncbi:MAG: hypothetical protein ACREJQ_03875, partial [bacterium]